MLGRRERRRLARERGWSEVTGVGAWIKFVIVHKLPLAVRFFIFMYVIFYINKQKSERQ